VLGEQCSDCSADASRASRDDRYAILENLHARILSLGFVVE
jgi:hypothetical protein